ncbi:mucin-7-like isoform X2 [Bufo gargarizans]|uniref:mucin-7-like isoform X2 n=1 Tax=Bufo gargarizans TaxID=30331 RepID=UPI001CF4D79B|nr:mucin-7-like isoform X2 [Bufo gargarizans]
MGGGRWVSALLLGLLCLLSGALTPGDAQEETSHPPAASPPPVSVSGPPDTTSEPPGNDLITDTERPSAPPSSTASVPESDGAGSSVTAASGDGTRASDEMASDPTGPPPVTASNRTTSADVTEPPAHNVTADTGTQTPSLLATLRASAAAETQPSDDSTPYTTTSMSVHSTSMSAITISLFVSTTVTSQERRSPATQRATAPHTSRAEVQREPSVLEVGDEKDLTGYPSGNSSNPLFVMIVSVFTIMVVMVVVVVGFHRYKKRNSRTEFRRLQDLPMDDMMEDTPLSLYSY